MPPGRLLLLTAILLSVGSLAAGSPALRPRSVLPKSDTIERPPFDSYLTVKFRDDVKARALGTTLRSSGGTDLTPLARVTERHALRYEPLIRLPQESLAALEVRASARSGAAQPDLAGIFVVHGPDAALGQAARDLLALDAVEWVEFSQLRPEPPCSDLAPPTPNYFSAGLQGYHNPNPGVDAGYAWSLGARGQGIRIADCEYGYIAGTEDLCDIVNEPGQTVHPGVAAMGWDDHGTAVLGEMAGLDNLYGVTGLSPDSDVLFFTEWSVEQGLRRETAIASAIAALAAGDIVVLEMQTWGVSGYGPAELSWSVWHLTKTATDAGVIVVAAAGNGSENLDDPGYASYRARGDSGAILVGAGSATTGHVKLGFSTYGSRVNVQGWGDAVFTLGYGSYAELGGDRKQRYRANFNGTSSAAPIVAGSAALLQSLSEQSFACRLDPPAMRKLLIDKGTPQGGGGHIGPLPNVRAAADALLAHGDCDWPHCGNGIREGSEACDGGDIGSCPLCAVNCSCASSTPGEAKNLLAVDFFAPGIILSYDPACSAADHTLVYGPLDQVASYGYTERKCALGAGGTVGPLTLGPGSYFFLVVGNDGLGVEGSYGRDSSGAERPALQSGPSCPQVQQLSPTCE